MPSRRKKPSRPKRTTKSELPDDFKSVARRLECDEDKGRFEAKLGKIAKARLPHKAGNA
jgi:hypothetical protein